MKNDALTLLIRAVLLMATGMVAFMVLELIPSFISGEHTLLNIASLSQTQAVTLMTSLSQGANELMTVAFTVVAIAVPLTADMYSLKFLEFIIKDRVITSILILTVFVNLNTSWVSGMITETHIPAIPMYLTIGLVIATFSLIFPYLYYVFRFLHPQTLLNRLEGEINEVLEQASSSPRTSAHARRRVAEGIEHLADIAIRTIERSDRSTAIECIHTLERVLHTYWKHKNRLPPNWFLAEESLFLGFASRAVADLNATRTWVEMKLLSQLHQIASAALSQLHDVVSTAAHTLRRLGGMETARRDPALRQLVSDYFNTFVRLAIVNRNTRAVFTVFDQYRTHAQSLNSDYPESVLEIAYYFEYYAQVARECGLTFIVESLAHDIGALVREAHESQAQNRHELLDRFLHYDGAAKPPLPGVKKAHAILASSFILSGKLDEAARIRDSFRGLDRAMLTTLRNELLRIEREEYWEVSGRRINIEYVPPAQREKLREFFDGLLSLREGEPDPGHESFSP